MTKTKEEQLKKLSSFPHNICGGDDLLGDFDSVVFFKRQRKTGVVRVTFEEYILRPFDGFDLHDKFNDGIAPKHKIMYGKIISETNGMYRLKVASDDGSEVWTGWCPKKSVTIEEMNQSENL